MKQIFCDSPIHKLFCLVLAFIILSCCVLPSFAKADDVEPSPSYPPIHPNVPVGWKDGDNLRDILLMVLDDWGITFRSLGSDLLSQFDILFEEFLEVSNEYAYEFWDDVKYGANEIGNLILDFTGVNRIRQFANWLIDKYQLTNNNTTPVYQVGNPSQFVQVPFYSGTDHDGIISHGGLYQIYHTSNYNTLTYVTVRSSASPVYHAKVCQQDGRIIGSFWFSLSSGPIAFLQSFAAIPDNTVVLSSANLTQRYGPYWYAYSSVSPGNAYGIYGSYRVDFPIFSSLQDIFDALDSTTQDTLVIDTRQIDIPTDTDITPDDGIEIEIPGTNWGDSIFTILDIIERLIGLYDSTQLNINTVIELLSTLLQGLVTPTTVENIPGGVIMDYDEYDIPIENEWGLFDIFYNTDGEDISILSPWQQLVAIIYGFPAPVLSLFALVVLFVVAYGFIRMGRDSH